MAFLRWLGAVILLFWIIGVIFRIGGMLINLLLIAAAVTFIADAFSSKKKYI